MNGLRRRRTSVLGCWSLSLLLTGCATAAPHPERPCLSCDDQLMVQIVPRASGPVDGSLAVYAHPLRLESRQWEAILRSVMVRSIHQPLLGSSYRGAAEPAFSAEEARYLGESLQRAFQQATAQEQVVFALARPSNAGLDQVTSGEWFAEDGRIHLRLANCRIAVTMPSIRKQIWRDPLFAQAGTFYELVPGEGQTIARSARDGGNPFRADPDELVIEYRGAMGATPAPVSSEPSVQPVPSRLLEAQLSLLKRLREQGLITEEDYHKKKQQLLDRL